MSRQKTLNDENFQALQVALASKLVVARSDLLSELDFPVQLKQR